MDTLTLPDKQLLRPAEVADYFRVHIETIRRWCKEGLLDMVIIPHGGYRIRSASVTELLKRKREGL